MADNLNHIRDSETTNDQQNLIGAQMNEVTQMRKSLSKNNTDHIRMGNFIALMLTVYLGGLQFGIVISMWNVAWKPFAFQYDLSNQIDGPENAESYKKNVIVQSVTVAACAVGALGAGIVVKYGRLKCLLFSNLLCIVGCVFQIFYKQYALFNFGRFLYGLAVGGFSVFSNQYVSEIAPKEISGQAGSLMQVSVVVGGLIPTAIGLIDITPENKSLQKNILEIMILIPAAVAVLQLLLLLTIFRVDTPTYYQQTGDMANVRRALAFVYKPYAIENKVNEILSRDDDQLSDKNHEEEKTVGFGDTCCNPMYSKATFIGISLAIFQQMTGVNIVYFYSNQIVGKGSGLAEGTATFMFQGISIVGVFSGMIMTGYLGRKTIMFWFSLLMGVILLGLGFSLQPDDPGILPLPLISAFVFFFQASSGPVTWLYMAEIMQEKGLSIGTVLNWLFTLFFSFVTPTIKNQYGLQGVGVLFMCVGGVTLGCAAFVMILMKETKGKTLAERKNLYVKQQAYI